MAPHSDAFPLSGHGLGGAQRGIPPNVKRFGSVYLCTSLVALAVACSVYTEDLLLDGTGGSGAGTTGGSAGASGNGPTGGSGQGGSVTGGSGGAGADTTGGQGGSGAVGPCGGSKRFPPPPAVDDDPNGDVGEQTSAMYRIDLGDRTPDVTNPPRAFLNIGFDIDETCTTAENPSDGECVLPDWALGSIDGPMGIDNSLGAIIQGVRNFLGDSFSSVRYTEQLQAGGVSVLFRLRDYNGRPNDSRVTVSTFVGAPFASTNGEGAEPNWDGNDLWPVASDSLSDPEGAAPLESARFEDRNAYVTDGKLVTTFPRTELRLDVALSALSNAKLDMFLTQAFVVCDVLEAEELPGRWHVDNCTIGGRWETDTLLKQLSQFSDPTSATGLDPLCTDVGLYRQFKESICRLTDVEDFPSGTGRSECNALSVGIDFWTRPAQLGDVWQLDSIPPRCPDATDPVHDSCDTLPPIID
jgi:hypothetical protein